MDFKLTYQAAALLIDILNVNYSIYAPKCVEGEGRYADTNSIRYTNIRRVSDIDFKHKSQYSVKEALLPINHTLGIEINGHFIPADNDAGKPLILFGRSCDWYALERLDDTFKQDDFYQKHRNGLKFILIECNGGWDTCFCVSMGTNKTESYDAAIRIEDGCIVFKTEDKDILSCLDSVEKSESEFNLQFVEENEMNVRKPFLREWDWQTLNQLAELPLWKTYAKRCIGCGSCNMACSTCTCLQTHEISLSGNTDIKEIHRVWNGCQVVMSDALKGAEGIGEIVPRRILQRVMDKFYRPRLDVSKEQTCVGCGRCIDICPSLINFGETVNRFCASLDALYEQTGATDEE